MVKEIRTIYIDIDGTICTNPEEVSTEYDYAKSSPIKENIEKANKLYDEGHKVVYWTSRGSLSGIDWTDLTKKQFKEWGVKHHELRLDKPFFDIFIDDKNINTKDWK